MESQNIQAGFRALADPTRRSILTLLSKEKLTIGEVSEQFDITRAAIKKHLVILNEGGFIEMIPEGRKRVNHLKPDGFKNTNQWLNHFDHYWDQKLKNLENAINKEIRK